MTKDDITLVAAIVFVGFLILSAISSIAGCSASLPYGRPGHALHEYIKAHSND